MTTKHPIESILGDIAGLDRQACKRHLRNFTRPRLDFTDEYLDSLSLDSLRHLLFAACEQARRSITLPPTG